MNQELKEHLAKLADGLRVSIRLQYSMDAGWSTYGYDSLSERYQVHASGFKTIHAITIGKVMQLSTSDFLKEDA